MSIESINSFREKVSGNSTLQVSLTDAMAKGPEAVIALGHAEGFAFDESDIQTAASSSGLTDFELGLVSGGLVNSRLMTQLMMGTGDRNVRGNRAGGFGHNKK